MRRPELPQPAETKGVCHECRRKQENSSDNHSTEGKKKRRFLSPEKKVSYILGIRNWQNGSWKNNTTAKCL